MSEKIKIPRPRRCTVPRRILEEGENPYLELAYKHWRNAWYRNAARPMTGAYYWLPTPYRKWDLDYYFDIEHQDESGDDFAAHVRIWPQVVLQLGQIWGKQEPLKLQRRLENAMYGLPRGRVTRTTGGFIIAHGNDSPPSYAFHQIKRAFNLQNFPVEMLFDEHEQTQQHALELIREELKRDFLGPKPPPKSQRRR